MSPLKRFCSEKQLEEEKGKPANGKQPIKHMWLWWCDYFTICRVYLCRRLYTALVQCIVGQAVIGETGWQLCLVRIAGVDERVKWAPSAGGRRTGVDVAAWQQQQQPQHRHHSLGHHHVVTGLSLATDWLHIYSLTCNACAWCILCHDAVFVWHKAGVLSKPSNESIW